MTMSEGAAETLGPIRPTALRRGARMAVVSPASTPKPELVKRGMELLQKLGYEPVLSPHALVRGPLYYAGTIQERVADLHAAFADPSVDGILCTRGGWGSAELLPYLDREIIKQNPKIFVGYSDHTSLHCWLQNVANIVTFYGPMVAADFAREGGVHAQSWQHCFRGGSGWALGRTDGLRVLRAGTADGVLRGGCLSILAETLGTPYAAEVRNSVLFLEDIGTKPYQWDRMLVHLRHSGLLDTVRGIVFGDMRQCVAAEEEDYLERAILHSLHEFTGPIAIGLPCGHVNGANITLPLGVRVRLDLNDTSDPRIEFLEEAVRGQVD